MNGTDLNYAALAVSILTGVSPETAFLRLEDYKPGRRFLDQDTIAMAELKEEGMSYKEIGDFFGVSKHAVRRRIKRLEEKEAKAI